MDMDAMFTSATSTTNNNSNNNNNTIPINNNNITAGVTATLMDMDAEEKEDEVIDEVMRTIRQSDHNNDNDNDNDDNNNNNKDNEEGRGEGEVKDPKEYASREEQINRDALFETYECNYKSIQKECDMLRKRLTNNDNELVNYVNEIGKLRSNNLDTVQLALQQKVDTERSDRLREADHLRAELSSIVTKDGAIKVHAVPAIKLLGWRCKTTN
jgi:hypothetical protein